MNFLVDSSVWQTALTDAKPTPASQRFASAIDEEEGIVTIGAIINELLFGFRLDKQADDLRHCFQRFCGIATITPTIEDHVQAASLQTRCAEKNFFIGATDALIAHLTVSRRLVLLSSDPLHQTIKTVEPNLTLWQADMDVV